MDSSRGFLGLFEKQNYSSVAHAVSVAVHLSRDTFLLFKTSSRVFWSN